VPFFEHLVTGRVTAAKGNAVSVGDAASLKIPLSGEGIGTALKSGILAASSILESIRTGRKVEQIYAAELRPLLKALSSSYEILEELKLKTGSGFLGALAEAFEASVSAPDF
jgi:flavin-dependent dehydrogenase